MSNGFRVNSMSARIAYGLHVQMKAPLPQTALPQTVCGRIAATYQASTGYEWWSGLPLSQHRNANFLNRVATAMAILDAERQGVDKTHDRG